MSLYAPASPEVPVPTIPDGIYTYAKVQVYGPATPTLIRVVDGTLFDYVVGTGDDAQVYPTDLLEEIQRMVFLELAWHIKHGLAERVFEELEVAT